MPRRWLAAPVVCGFCTIAFGAACDSGQRHREPIVTMDPAPMHSAAAAKRATVLARVAAIGDTAPLAPDLRRGFDPTPFEPMPEPGPDDWLARHPEKPQSFEEYLRAARNVPSPQARG